MLDDLFKQMGRDTRRELKHMANEIPWEYRAAFVVALLLVAMLLSA